MQQQSKSKNDNCYQLKKSLFQQQSKSFEIQELMAEDSENQDYQKKNLQRQQRNSPGQQSVKNIQKLQAMLKMEFSQIKHKILRHTNYILKNKKQNNFGFDKEQVTRCFLMFEQACENTLKSFFTIASNPQYLRFQSQTSLIEKVDFIKTQLDRSSLALVKKLSKTKSQLQQQDQKRKASLRLKGKNCKTSPKSTVILQKWLLQNFYEPYPTERERQKLSRQSNLSIYQVNNWLINTREKIIRRYLKKQTKISTISQQSADGKSLESQNESLQKISDKFMNSQGIQVDQ